MDGAQSALVVSGPSPASIPYNIERPVVSQDLRISRRAGKLLAMGGEQGKSISLEPQI